MCNGTACPRGVGASPALGDSAFPATRVPLHVGARIVELLARI